MCHLFSSAQHQFDSKFHLQWTRRASKLGTLIADQCCSSRADSSHGEFLKIDEFTKEGKNEKELKEMKRNLKKENLKNLKKRGSPHKLLFSAAGSTLRPLPPCATVMSFPASSYRSPAAPCRPVRKPRQFETSNHVVPRPATSLLKSTRTHRHRSVFLVTSLCCNTTPMQNWTLAISWSPWPHGAR